MVELAAILVPRLSIVSVLLSSHVRLCHRLVLIFADHGLGLFGNEPM